MIFHDVSWLGVPIANTMALAKKIRSSDDGIARFGNGTPSAQILPIYPPVIIQKVVENPPFVSHFPRDTIGVPHFSVCLPSGALCFQGWGAMEAAATKRSPAPSWPSCPNLILDLEDSLPQTTEISKMWRVSVDDNNSLTWNQAFWGWFPLLTIIPVRSQWGRYNLPRRV